jgi:hypothetical protein
MTYIRGDTGGEGGLYPMPTGEEGTYCHIKLSTPPARLSTDILSPNSYPHYPPTYQQVIHRQIVTDHLEYKHYLCGVLNKMI